MKTSRIASSLALAAALALGATGCSLIAPQGTLKPYAPSDGINVTIDNVAVRNMMLIVDESGENFNVVFTGVNNTTDNKLVRITFVDGSSEASADFDLAPGLNAFGNPKGDVAPTLVSIPGLKAGNMVQAYFEVAGGGDEKYEVPVLDGTLPEYRDYVLSKSQVAKLEAASTSEAGKSTAEAQPAPATEAQPAPAAQ